MELRTVLSEFAGMLKVGSKALTGLIESEKLGDATAEVLELLRRTDQIADRLYALSEQNASEQTYHNNASD